MGRPNGALDKLPRGSEHPVEHSQPLLPALGAQDGDHGFVEASAWEYVVSILIRRRSEFYDRWCVLFASVNYLVVSMRTTAGANCAVSSSRDRSVASEAGDSMPSMTLAVVSNGCNQSDFTANNIL